MTCLSLSETHEGHLLLVLLLLLLLLVLLLLLLLLSLLGTGHWVNSCACSSLRKRNRACVFAEQVRAEQRSRCRQLDGGMFGCLHGGWCYHHAFNPISRFSGYAGNGSISSKLLKLLNIPKQENVGTATASA
jgi:hypothetical protein